MLQNSISPIYYTKKSHQKVRFFYIQGGLYLQIKRKLILGNVDPVEGPKQGKP